MKSSYKKLGKYIQEVNKRDTDKKVTKLLGVSIRKVLMPSIANIIGTDMSTYKIIQKNQFAYGPVTSRNGDKISVALLDEYDEAIVSQAYTVFEVIDKNELLPEYLMMWFRRPEFDRYARFKSHGSAREIFGWDEMCDTELPIPSIEKQKEIVKEYHILVNRIDLNNQLITKLEETAQAIYKQWFVDFEFPDEIGLPYKSNGGEMIESELGEIPVGWDNSNIGKYSKVKSGFAFKSEWWENNGVPVIKIRSINENTIDYKSLGYVTDDKVEKAKNYKVKKGGIVIAMTGATIGKIGLIPELNNTILVNQRVGMFELGNEPLNDAPFLYLYLLSDFVQNEIRNVGGDSAQANISNGQIENISMILPNKNLINDFNILMNSSFNTILNKIKENSLLEQVICVLLSKMATIEN
ncbi:TPA: restriction endonuclease subunit S [Flavobacterium psychrophilum]